MVPRAGIAQAARGTPRAMQPCTPRVDRSKGRQGEHRRTPLLPLRQEPPRGAAEPRPGRRFRVVGEPLPHPTQTLHHSSQAASSTALPRCLRSNDTGCQSAPRGIYRILQWPTMWCLGARPSASASGYRRGDTFDKVCQEPSVPGRAASDSTIRLLSLRDTRCRECRHLQPTICTAPHPRGRR